MREGSDQRGASGGRVLAGVRRVVAAGTLVVLITGASAVGLHEWADEQTTAAAQQD